MQITLNDLKTWLPILASIIVVVISIVGQYMIFRLNKRKDINIKVAELYGKFNAMTMQFNITFYEYNHYNMHQTRSDVLYLHYSSVAEDPKYKKPDPKDIFELDYEMAREQQLKQSDEYNKGFNEAFSNHKKEMLEMLEILYQVHFYHNDKKLNEYISDFRNIKLLPFKVEYSEELINELDFQRYTKAYITGGVGECKDIFARVTQRMLDLS